MTMSMSMMMVMVMVKKFNGSLMARMNYDDNGDNDDDGGNAALVIDYQ